MWDPRISIEEVDDPAEIERHRAQLEQFARNSRWLEAHWPELLPHAYGKFLAVAGEEAFLADSPEDAWAWAQRAHCEDRGPVVQYVMPAKGPRR
jgi:hypothetical protein